MSPLDKLIMKTLKKMYRFLLEVRSSFIWNSADVDLRSCFKDLRADGHNAHISAHMVSISSIGMPSLLLVPLHTGRSESRPALRLRRRTPLSWIYVVLVAFVCLGVGGGRRGRG